ncbi:MAG TPA: nuclear transport factor 2 family protein [Candidatus Binatia bacterium]|nr:nuclear transport factor 2 family protein [Candidatus Binatia bacterium]
MANEEAETTAATRLAALEQRVGALEDELAIHRLIVRYGFAVDTGSADETGDLFTEDAVYDVDRTLVMRGRNGVRDMVRGPNHQSLLPNCAHTIGPAVVEVAGDRAIATAYSRIYRRKPGGIELWRLSFNRFELVRDAGAWRIASRTTRMVGHEEAQAVLRGGLPTPR